MLLTRCTQVNLMFYCLSAGRGCRASAAAAAAAATCRGGDCSGYGEAHEEQRAPLLPTTWLVKCGLGVVAWMHVQRKVVLLRLTGGW